MTQADIITDNLPLIRRLARHRSTALAEDVAQEACLMIMDGQPPRLDGTLEGYLFWKVRGAFDVVRKRQIGRLVTGGLHNDPPMPANQEHVVDLAAVRSRVAALPPRQREAVEMLLEENDYSEIGASMGVSKQAAHQLVQRARPALGLAA